MDSTPFEHDVLFPDPRDERPLARLYVRWRRLVPRIARKRIENSLLRIRKRGFDLYVSLGNSCLAASVLKNAGLRDFSGPFDWLCGGSLQTHLEFLRTNFRDFLRYEDLTFEPKTKQTSKFRMVARNERTGIRFLHDFNGSDEAQFREVREKYRRRAERLYEIGQGKSALFLYTEAGVDRYDYAKTPEALLSAAEELQSRLGLASLTFLLLVRAERTSDGIERYRRGSCTLCLREVASPMLENGMSEELAFTLFVIPMLETLSRSK